jgi:hypothetical protein
MAALKLANNVKLPTNDMMERLKVTPGESRNAA